MSIVSNTPSVTLRRTLNVTRKPRPISIAVTGVSVLDGDLIKLNNKHQQQKPPLPTKQQNFNNKKKSLNIMSRSMDMSNKLIDSKNSPRQSIINKTNDIMVQSCFDETTSNDLIKPVPESLIDISIESPSIEQLTETITTTTTTTTPSTTTEILQEIVEDVSTNILLPIDAENNEMTGLFPTQFLLFILMFFSSQLQRFLRIELQLKKKLKPL